MRDQKTDYTCIVSNFYTLNLSFQSAQSGLDKVSDAVIVMQDEWRKYGLLWETAPLQLRTWPQKRRYRRVSKVQDKEADPCVPQFVHSCCMSLFWYVRRHEERTTTQGTSVHLRLRRLRRLRQPLLSLLSSRCISGIETCLKTVSSDQFPGHRQEGGGETRRDEEAQHCKVRGGSQEGPNHVRHYRPPERKKEEKKLLLRFKCWWQFL